MLPKSKSNPFYDFLKTERALGVILIVCTIVSLSLANSGISQSYLSFWNLHLGSHTLLYWINDGLMAVFFLVVGMEIKRELLKGELSTFKQAILPLVAALGGMVVPATIYALINGNTPYAAGWGIPMATDIAFALGILSLVGSRVPISLKIFLTALAVIDDLGAILVIALFYSSGIVMEHLLISIALFLVLLLINKLKVSSLIPYLGIGCLMWYFMSLSGVHPTVAGVLLAITIPIAENKNGYSPLISLEPVLHRFSSFIIMPLFALANTAIVFSGSIETVYANTLSMGIMLGLFIGKPIGITLFSMIAVKSGWAILPSGATMKKVIGIGFLGGIGFTMSIFISLLAFDNQDLHLSAKLAVLTASLLSGVVGYVVLRERVIK